MTSRFARILATVLLVGSLGLSSGASSGWRLVAATSTGSDLTAGNGGAASGSGAPTAAPATQGSPSVHKAPASIPSDCSKDVTRAILNWIASVPDGATLVFARNGCYRIDGSLIIMDRVGLTFEGNGATFKAMTDGDINRAHFWFFGGGDLTLRNMTVRGANPRAGARQEAYRPSREFQHAYALQGVQRALLENLQAYDVYGDFVYIDGDGGQRWRPRPRYSRWSRNITVRNSRFVKNGRHGVAIIAAENVTITNNYFQGIRWDAFDLESDHVSQGARQIRIVGNRTRGVWLVWLGIGGPAPNVSDIYVARNVMETMSGVPVIYSDAPEGAMWGPLTIEDNSFQVGWSPRGAFEFKRTTDVMFRRNAVAMPSGRYAAYQTVAKLFDAHHIRVTDNTLTGRVGQILWADGSSSDYAEYNNRVEPAA